MGNLSQKALCLVNASGLRAGQERKHDPAFCGTNHDFVAITLHPAMMLRVTPGAVAIHTAQDDPFDPLTSVPSRPSCHDETFVGNDHFGVDEVFANRLATLQPHGNFKQSMRASVTV